MTLGAIPAQHLSEVQIPELYLASIPWENGYIESFFDKLRDECLNREVFCNGQEAQATVKNWRQEYNNCLLHSSLDYLTPAEFARRYYETRGNGRTLSL